MTNPGDQPPSTGFFSKVTKFFGKWIPHFIKKKTQFSGSKKGDGADEDGDDDDEPELEGEDGEETIYKTPKASTNDNSAQTSPIDAAEMTDESISDFSPLVIITFFALFKI